MLTDYLDLSVGGTLTVGGIGGTSSGFGAQGDTVVALEVVTGEGEVVRCSAEHRRDLFDAVRAGLGQTAVITRATLRLVPAPARVRRTLLFYATPRAMRDDARLLSRAGEFDAVQGAVLPGPDGGWVFRLDAAAYDDASMPSGLADDEARRESATLSYPEYVDRLSPLEAALRAGERWHLPHPWLMTFLPDDTVEAALAAELEALEPERDLGPFSQITLSPLRTERFAAPLLRLPDGKLCFTLNLTRFPDDSEAQRLVAANRAAYERITARGGTLYPVSALPMSPQEWRAHFGPAFERLRDAKARFDPGRVLTPGYELF